MVRTQREGTFCGGTWDIRHTFKDSEMGGATAYPNFWLFIMNFFFFSVKHTQVQLISRVGSVYVKSLGNEWKIINTNKLLIFAK